MVRGHQRLGDPQESSEVVREAVVTIHEVIICTSIAALHDVVYTSIDEVIICTLHDVVYTSIAALHDDHMHDHRRNSSVDSNKQ